MRAGRLRELITISKRTEEQGTHRQQLKTLEKLFSARANVKVVSGVELLKAGASLTKEVVSILMRYDARLKYDHFVTHNSNDYDVVSIKPTEKNRDMIITATRDI